MDCTYLSPLSELETIMNQTNHPDSTLDAPWSPSGTRVQVPDTSMLPGSESARPAAAGMLKHAVQGAHATIDRLADVAAPAVQQLGERVSAAEAALHVKAGQLRDTRDQWAEGARSTVRDNPLVCVAAAFALGAVISRVLQTPR